MDRPGDHGWREDDGLVAELETRIRQRRSELAAREASGLEQGLHDLQVTQHLEEPVPFSGRPVLGRLVVAVRKAFVSLLLRWYSRPLVEQQSAFNRAVTLRMRDLVAGQRSLRRRLEALEQRLGRGHDDER